MAPKMVQSNTDVLGITLDHIEALQVARGNTNFGIGIIMCHFFAKKRSLLIPILIAVFKRDHISRLKRHKVIPDLARRLNTRHGA